jgi:hypothetical protein
VALHRYHLEIEELEEPEARGVLVFRRLGPDLFQRLAEAIDASEGGDAA